MHTMTADPIYYEDQTDWKPADYYALWRYLERLFGFIGPSASLQAALDHPENLSDRDRAKVRRVAGIQAKRTGRRDDELAAMDLSRMSEETRYLAKHVLISMERYELALDRFPNLRGLDDVGDLGHPIYLEVKPKRAPGHLTDVGIYL